MPTGNPFKQEQREAKATALLDKCAALLKAGKRVDAAKLYRSETRATLKEALKVLDSIGSK